MVEVDEFDKHEVLHTASIISTLFDREISDHLATKSNEHVRLKAAEISEALGEFYQLCGREFIG